jgi:P27 family predicted phage terminase small subunit
MGRRGPAPEPTRLKLIKGVKPSRVNLDEPMPLDRAVDRPPWLSDLAAEEWDRTAPHLAAMGIVTEADLPSFAVYCEAVARWRRLAELVAQSPPVVSRDGAVVKNPVYSQVRDAAIEVRLFAREFGLTPSARAGIRVERALADTAARLLTDG